MGRFGMYVDTLSEYLAHALSLSDIEIQSLVIIMPTRYASACPSLVLERSPTVQVSPRRRDDGRRRSDTL